MSPFHRDGWKTLWAITAPFFRSAQRWRAFGCVGLLVTLVLGVSYLNYRNSYVGRDVMTSLAERHAKMFAKDAVKYVGLFAALTVAAVLLRFTEERLGLFWRQWLTGHLINRYLAGNAYYRLTARPDIDNPDQRITEDVKSFTTATLAFLLVILNATINLVVFAGVLWDITPMLFLVATGYAAAGTFSTLFLGRKLMGLNFEQLKREADLRYEMIRVARARGIDRPISRRDEGKRPAAPPARRGHRQLPADRRRQPQRRIFHDRLQLPDRGDPRAGRRRRCTLPARKSSGR